MQPVKKTKKKAIAYDLEYREFELMKGTLTVLPPDPDAGMREVARFSKLNKLLPPPPLEVP